MGQKFTTPLWVHDIAAALGLLTRLPITVDEDLAMSRSASAAWAYPVVGFMLGGLSLLLFTLLAVIGLPPVVAVVLIVAFHVTITGAMHLDGLADSVDGLWGGWTVERRLEIMKDSHIGVYGVCALVVSLLLSTVALYTLALHPLFALAVLGGAGLSRALMVVVMQAMPNARDGGLSQSVGRPPAQTMWIALGLGLGGVLILGLLIGQLWAAILMGVIGIAATVVCAAIAKRKIKGQTGDILGAVQQVSELAMLVSLTAFVY